MSIIVVCPGCLKSFNVADKFAGRTGPCPNCKKPIRIPTKAEEVKIEAPAAFSSGGRSISGKLITKPIARLQTKFHPVKTAIIVASVLVVLVVAGAMGGVLRENMIASTVGLLVVSLPIVMAAYPILRNVDFEPYSGKDFYLRASLCSLGYVLLWGMFSLLASPDVELITGEMWNWVFIVPPFVAIGGLIAMATFDLEYGDAIFHYCFYLLTTLLLRWVVGMTWVWNIGNT